MALRTEKKKGVIYVKYIIEYQSFLGVTIRMKGTVSPSRHLDYVYLLHHTLPKPLRCSVYALSMQMQPFTVDVDVNHVTHIPKRKELAAEHPPLFFWLRDEEADILVLDLDLLSIPFSWEYEVRTSAEFGTQVYCKAGFVSEGEAKGFRTLLRSGEKKVRNAKKNCLAAISRVKSLVEDAEEFGFKLKEMDSRCTAVKKRYRTYRDVCTAESKYTLDDYLRELEQQKEMVQDGCLS